MKTYNKPQTLSLHIAHQELLAASPGVETGSTVVKEQSTSSQKTREGGGFGTGMWEDMN